MNEFRIRRIILLAAAVATLLAPLIALPAFLAGGRITAGWWTPLSAALITAAGLVLLVTVVPTRIDRPRRAALRVAALLLAAANTAASVTWLFAWTGEGLPYSAGVPVWHTHAVSLGAVGIAATVSVRWALVYVVIGLPLLGTVQQLAKFGEMGAAAYLNLMMTASLLLVFLAMLRSGLEMAAVIDAEQEREREEAIASSRRLAGERERARLHTVVQDRVIAVLRSASPGRADVRRRYEAQAALDDLYGEVTTVDRVPRDVPPAGAVAYLRQAAYSATDDVLVAVEAGEDASAVPPRVVESLGDAVAEAVANARAHAGTAASTVVVGHLGPNGVRLRVVDDGGGFDPTLIRERGGIDTDIRERMSTLPGGRAVIESTPGEGTTVSLEWSRS